jgi:hypothetical protein
MVLGLSSYRFMTSKPDPGTDAALALYCPVQEMHTLNDGSLQHLNVYNIELDGLVNYQKYGRKGRNKECVVIF